MQGRAPPGLRPAGRGWVRAGVGCLPIGAASAVQTLQRARHLKRWGVIRVPAAAAEMGAVHARAAAVGDADEHLIGAEAGPACGAVRRTGFLPAACGRPKHHARDGTGVRGRKAPAALAAFGELLPFWPPILPAAARCPQGHGLRCAPGTRRTKCPLRSQGSRRALCARTLHFAGLAPAEIFAARTAKERAADQDAPTFGR